MGLRLTMVGVRRSSCRPSPPRIIVLPVSIMTTLESRKPMLLIVLGVVDAFERICVAGLGLGWPWLWRVSLCFPEHTSTNQQQLNEGRLGAEAPRPLGRRRSLSCVPSTSIVVHPQWNGSCNFPHAPHTRQEILFAFGIAIFVYTRESGIFSRLMA